MSIFEDIVDLFDTNHEKKNYAEIQGVRDVLLWYDVILLQLLANHFQISNRIRKLLQSSTMQILSFYCYQVNKLKKITENKWIILKQL